MKAVNLIFEQNNICIDIFAPMNDSNGKLYKVGKILPFIDGTFYIDSDDLEPPFLQNRYKTIDKAKVEAQKLFEIWINKFLLKTL